MIIFFLFYTFHVGDGQPTTVHQLKQNAMALVLGDETCVRLCTITRACVRPSGRGSECQMWLSFIIDEGDEHEGLGFFVLFSFVFFFVSAAEFRRSDFYCITAAQRADLLMPRL